MGWVGSTKGGWEGTLTGTQEIAEVSGWYGINYGTWDGTWFGLPSITVTPPHGGIGHGGKRHKKPELCVISVDGQDYRVHVENVYAFLERQKEARPKVEKKTKKARKAIAKSKPPKIVIKSAPIDYISQIQASVDRSNEILRKIWEGNLTRLINEAEQEEAIALVLMMDF
jgi:hypothetical protein